MKVKSTIRLAAAGFCAGSVTGLFGGGGGMLLVPLLLAWTNIDDGALFPTSLCIMLPICLVLLTGSALADPLPWHLAWPYLLSGAIGGLAAGIWGKNIPVCWLHRGLGLLILWGGVRYLW